MTIDCVIKKRFRLFKFTLNLYFNQKQTKQIIISVFENLKFCMFKGYIFGLNVKFNEKFNQ